MSRPSRRFPFFLPLLPLLAAWCALLPVPAGRAQLPPQTVAKVKPFTVQTQGYAVLDLSGADAIPYVVPLLVLGDDNKAVFTTRTPDLCQVWTLANGVLSLTQSLALTGNDPNRFHDGVLAPAALTLAGDLYGSYGAMIDMHGIIFSGWRNPFSASHGAVSQLGLAPFYDLHGLTLLPSPGGSFGAFDTAIYADNPPLDGSLRICGYLSQDGLTTVFIDQALLHAFPHLPPGVVLVGVPTIEFHPGDYIGTFIPWAMNARGHAIGQLRPFDPEGRYQVTGPAQFWDGAQLLPLPGLAVALNEQDDVLGTSFGVNTAAAFLWQPARAATATTVATPPATTPLSDLLPEPARPHFRNLYAVALSNQATPPAAGAPVAPVLHVVFTGEIRRRPDGPDDGWAYATFLLRKLSDGTTDLHEIDFGPSVVIPWQELGGPGTDYNSPFLTINAQGVIAATGNLADPLTGIRPPDYVPGSHALLLAPVDLAVDADRNGLVEFERDITSPAHPLRFWTNEDHSINPLTGIPGAPTNSSDEIINGVEDLQNVLQIKFRLPPLLNELVKAHRADLGFKWRKVTGGSPAVRLWSGSPNLDRPTYLKDLGVADQTVYENSFNMLLTDLTSKAHLVTGGSTVWLRDTLLDDATSDTVNLLLEGVNPGTGKLTLVVRFNGVESEGPDVDFKLLNVRQMYARGKVPEEAPAVADPWLNRPPPTLGWGWDPLGWPPDEDPFAEEKTIVFVHGWRMTNGEYLQWADTTYKRLWQLGYQGRFYSFRWPTYSGETIGFDPVHYYKPGGFTYNHSEYRAWLSGPALASFVNGLPNAENRYLIAHSMGNVVSGVALRNSMQVTRYAMCNAAMAAMAYDGTISNFNFITPDTDANDDTRQRFGLADKLNFDSTEIVNFYLEPDSSLGLWVQNNQMFKPQPLDSKTFFLHQYGYFSQFAPGEKLQYGIRLNNFNWITSRVVTALPEAMGYVTQSRSLPAGAVPEVHGRVILNVNMGKDGFGFDKEHSAEWVYSIQKTYPFWRRIAEEFRAADLTNR